MTRKIKHVSELPEWFKLEKYEEAENLTATGWYHQINIRSRLYENRNYRNYTDLDGEESTSNSLSSYFDDLLKSICSKPIIDVNKDELCQNREENIPAHKSGIHSLSLKEYAMIGKTVCSKKLKAVHEFWGNAFHANENRIIKSPPYGGDPVYKFGDGDIRFDNYWDVTWIDLALPDDLLIENFRSYLKIRRESMPETINEPMKKCNFENWYRLGLLPFIDLYLWSEVENIPIPYRVIADAIFPFGDRGEETIRKTTKPLAQFILTDISRMQLASLAFGEYAEKKSK